MSRTFLYAFILLLISKLFKFDGADQHGPQSARNGVTIRRSSILLHLVIPFWNALKEINVHPLVKSSRIINGEVLLVK